MFLFGLDKHDVSRFWKKIAIQMKLLKQRRQKEKDKENHAKNKRQLFCTHCHKQGHLVDKCWILYPASHPRHLKKVEKENI